MNPEIISFPRIAQQFYFEPLALEESAMLACHMYLWPRVTGKVQDSAPFMEAKEAANPGNIMQAGTMAHMRKQRAEPNMQSTGPWSPPTIIDGNYYWSVEGKPQVAIIPVNGMISKGVSPFAESCMGAVNPDRVALALQQATAAKGVKQIVFDIGSPGGRTTFTPELSAQIKAAANTRGKTVYAFTDTMIASAAEWMASQANEVIMTASSQIGSIGTYLAFLNPKVAMQTQGYQLELFSRGTHKGLGLPGRDLTQADREYLQATVDKLNAEFVSAVKAGRPKVSEEALRDAKMYDGPEAIKHGLADGIVSSWEEFIGLL
jgi:ClpP class serine protease